MLLYIILIFQDKPYNYYMDVKKELGLKIKRLRQKEGLTQEQFAEKLNIATRTLAGIEIGESFVSAQTIENILNYTNISFEDFLDQQKTYSMIFISIWKKLKMIEIRSKIFTRS